MPRGGSAMVPPWPALTARHRLRPRARSPLRRASRHGRSRWPRPRRRAGRSPGVVSKLALFSRPSSKTSVSLWPYSRNSSPSSAPFSASPTMRSTAAAVQAGAGRRTDRRWWRGRTCDAPEHAAADLSAAWRRYVMRGHTGSRMRRGKAARRCGDRSSRQCKPLRGKPLRRVRAVAYSRRNGRESAAFALGSRRRCGAKPARRAACRRMVRRAEP